MSTSPSTEAFSFAPKVRQFVAQLEQRKSSDVAASGEATRDELIDELRLQQEELRGGQEALRQSAEALENAARSAAAAATHYRDVFALAPDPFFVTDPVGRVVELNSAAVELVGPDALGTPFESLLHPEDVGVVRRLVACMTTEVQRVRVRFQARTGRMARAGLRGASSTEGREMLWMARLERGGSGELPAIPSSERISARQSDLHVATLTAELDVAERKVVAERMAREDADGRERTKQWTMAIVAHGLRLPIEHIRHWCVKLGDDDPSAIALGAEVVRRHAAVQAELVEDLLDVSRIAHHQLRSGFTAVDPADAARFAATTFEHIAAENRVTVSCRIQALGAIQADPVRLIQALTNVVWVAVELSSPHQVVVIDGDRTEESASITVTWRGEPLRHDQLDWDLTRLGEGQVAGDRVGMSCLVARQLVQLHGGRLRSVRTEDQHALVATFATRLPSLPPPSSTPRPRR